MFVNKIIILFLCFDLIFPQVIEQTDQWKFLGYDIDGIIYINDTDYEYKDGTIHFDEPLQDHEKFFIQKNIIPYGLASDTGRQIFSIPRIRPGIPSTLNAVKHAFPSIPNYDSPLLYPYPNTKVASSFVSIFNMRSENRYPCLRFWFVDTGYLDIPGARNQVQPPMLVAFNTLKGAVEVKVIIEDRLLKNAATAGLTLLRLIFHGEQCSNTIAYITDMTSDALIEFSLEDKKIWRIERPDVERESWSSPFTVKNLAFIEMAGKLIGESQPKYDVMKNEALTPENARVRHFYTGVYHVVAAYQDKFMFLFTNEERTRLYCWNPEETMEMKNVHHLTDFKFPLLAMNMMGYSFTLMMRRNVTENYDVTKINLLRFTGTGYVIFEISDFCRKSIT